MTRGYGDFAEVYDELTQNVPYKEIAEYYAKILGDTADVKRLLDVGCGTGNLTIRLREMGFDVVGLDGSSEMLSCAMAKCPDIFWVCQDMTKIDLGEEFDAVISTLDSINHLESKAEIERCFRCVNENLRLGGAFVFDVNTVYKHREILGSNTFVYDAEGAYCVWMNEFSEENNSVSIDLDIFFEEEDGSYTRGGESFGEIALTADEMAEMLGKCGFEIVKTYDYLSFDAPAETSEKLMISAMKIMGCSN
ncbi:MAG: class I SAM-dependent methyltransferase [Oscillospiraceae bacterium]|nr:class I SAM-dependent methyltransferase [Oscillospiraceae bacterium]